MLPKAKPTRIMLGLDGSGLVAVKAFLLMTKKKLETIDKHKMTVLMYIVLVIKNMLSYTFITRVSK